MKIVLTNDDGLEAEGLAALRRVFEGIGETIIVAPDREFSGCGHQVTTTSPIVVREVADAVYEVRGTPADCTRIALTQVAPDADLVAAGINAGGNMGVDVFISGTVAAAREAVILGKPAIAVSQYRRRHIPLDWGRAARWSRGVVERLVERMLGDSALSLWNINLPSLGSDEADPEVVECPLDTSPHEVRFAANATESEAEGLAEYLFAGTYDRRPRVPGRDVDVCQGGRIALTRLQL